MLQAGAVLYLFLKISMAILENFEFMLRAKIEIEFLGQNSTPNPIRHHLLAAYLLAR